MTDNSALDTTINEPSMTADEVEMLLFFLDRSRAQFAWKCGGLDEAGLRKKHPPSDMTLGGLLKHLTIVEDCTTYQRLPEKPAGSPPWDERDAENPWAWGWRTADDDSADELYTQYRDAVARAREAWTQAIAEGGLDQPSKMTNDAGEPANLRRILIDVIEEYTRHAGHADMLREAVDGLVGLDPPQK